LRHLADLGGCTARQAALLGWPAPYQEATSRAPNNPQPEQSALLGTLPDAERASLGRLRFSRHVDMFWRHSRNCHFAKCTSLLCRGAGMAAL
jgi:hypothetical protein